MKRKCNKIYFLYNSNNDILLITNIIFVKSSITNTPMNVINGSKDHKIIRLFLYIIIYIYIYIHYTHTPIVQWHYILNIIPIFFL